MAAPELVARCFAARTAAHVAHLKTRSYAAHMALGSFYDDIVDKVDSFAEVYQGHFGLMSSIPALKPDQGEDILKLIQELGDWCSDYRAECAKGKTDLENIIDEITALCASTVYKLTYLK